MKTSICYKILQSGAIVEARTFSAKRFCLLAAVTFLVTLRKPEWKPNFDLDVGLSVPNVRVTVTTVNGWLAVLFNGLIAQQMSAVSLIYATWQFMLDRLN